MMKNSKRIGKIRSNSSNFNWQSRFFLIEYIFKSFSIIDLIESVRDSVIVTTVEKIVFPENSPLLKRVVGQILK